TGTQRPRRARRLPAAARRVLRSISPCIRLLCVGRLQQLGHRSRDSDLAAEDLGALDVEVAQALANEPERHVVGVLGGRLIAKDADGQDLAVAAVHELVRHEPRLSRDLVRKAGVNTAHQLLHGALDQAVTPDAGEHSLLPSLVVPKRAVVFCRGYSLIVFSWSSAYRSPLKAMRLLVVEDDAKLAGAVC